jgi:Dolichyl-phosphate-mannose-protein mannosyltransferase
MRIGAFEITASRTQPWPSRRTVRWLSAILLLSVVLGVRGLDWGLPYQWHPDEKIMVGDTMVRERTLEPPHFINPSLHAYAAYVTVRLAYALEPRRGIRYRNEGLLELTDPAHPDRRLLMLAFRLTRFLSVVFHLVTVWLLYRVGRYHFDETTGLVAAWYGAVTMGLVNMAHFATGESMLFMLCLWSLWRFALVADRGTWRDYAVAGLATGLACSTKYTPWLLAAPFLVAHFHGRGIRQGLSGAGIGRMAVTFASTIGGFLLGSPYAVIAWPLFRDALIVTWFTGAPSGSLAGLERSWGPYIGILANALGWPLFVLALVGGLLGLLQLVGRDGSMPRRRCGDAIHVSWILAFYAFYGITSHRALRFIMPIGPSLVLLAAAAGMSIVRSASRPIVQRAGIAVVTGVGIYSTVYAARATHMFATDTRYAAGRWIQSLPMPPGMPVDYFTIESYLPYFVQPTFPLRHVPYVLATDYRTSAFWKEMLPYFENPANGIIVDSDAFYPRYFDLSVQARLPERMQVYRMLFSGQGSPFRLVARITSHGPWWLDPRPELVSPEMVVFATRAVVPDSAVMSPMPAGREDVMRLMPK